MGQSVACVVDVASRAAELSGDAFDLSVQTEEHDGVRYVRLVTDPASMVMPLSAFRYVAAWAVPKSPETIAQSHNAGDGNER